LYTLLTIKKKLRKKHPLDVRALRGPLTLALIQQKVASNKINGTPPYGDPALLLPYLFPDRFVWKPTLPYVAVVHHIDNLPSKYNQVFAGAPWDHVSAENALK
jgi:hypothetical protein